MSLKLKALHELGRFIWLEDRLKGSQQEPVDITDGVAYAEHLRRMQEANERRRAALELPEVKSRRPRSTRAFSEPSSRSKSMRPREIGDDFNADDPPYDDDGV